MTLRAHWGYMLLALSVVFALVIGFLPIVASAVPGINTLSSNDLHGLTSSDRLEDLKRARDMNLISEAEYETRRQTILDEM